MCYNNVINLYILSYLITFPALFCKITITQNGENTMAHPKTLAFLNALHDAPVIAAVKSNEDLSRAMTSDCAAIFFLYGTILNIADLVKLAKDGGKLALVHVDLVEGLSSRDNIAVDFLAENTLADGIISTRPNLIRRAKEVGLISVQRFFLLDSIAYENVLRQSSNADVVDVLPGTMPRVLARLSSRLSQPLIASGLLADKQDVIAALGAGAVAVSTTSEPLWFV